MFLTKIDVISFSVSCNVHYVIERWDTGAQQINKKQGIGMHWFEAYLGNSGMGGSTGAVALGHKILRSAKFQCCCWQAWLLDERSGLGEGPEHTYPAEPVLMPLHHPAFHSSLPAPMAEQPSISRSQIPHPHLESGSGKGLWGDPPPYPTP